MQRNKVILQLRKTIMNLLLVSYQMINNQIIKINCLKNLFQSVRTHMIKIKMNNLNNQKVVKVKPLTIKKNKMIAKKKNGNNNLLKQLLRIKKPKKKSNKKINFQLQSNQMKKPQSQKVFHRKKVKSYKLKISTKLLHYQVLVSRQLSKSKNKFNCREIQMEIILKTHSK